MFAKMEAPALSKEKFTIVYVRLVLMENGVKQVSWVLVMFASCDVTGLMHESYSQELQANIFITVLF